MIVEVDSVLSDSAEFRQRKELEPAAVGQNRVWPAHESMKSAKVTNHFETWSKEKMIGVAEDDLSADGLKFIGSHCFDCALGTDRHKDRRFNDPVSGDQSTAAGL